MQEKQITVPTDDIKTQVNVVLSSSIPDSNKVALVKILNRQQKVMEDLGVLIHILGCNVMAKGGKVSKEDITTYSTLVTEKKRYPLVNYVEHEEDGSAETTLTW